MKQFNLEEYQKNPSRKVITRDGKSVRIICTDKRKDDYPILALCSMNDGSERLSSYLHNGKEYLTEDSYRDLFFAPEKREGWINLAINSNGDVFVATNYPYKSEEAAKSVVSGKSNIIATCKIEWEE